MDHSTLSDETRTLIETTVREHLVGYDLAPCKIKLVDDEGDTGIDIGIYYNSAGPPMHPRVRLSLLRELRDKLVASRDWRMPFVEHYYADDQQLEGLRRAR
jgi:hypothetical protein